MNKYKYKAALCVFAMTQAAHAGDEWQDYTGEERLTTLFSGTKLHVELRNGVTGAAEVRSDHTATLHAWSSHFERTWKVNDGKQVCFTGDDGTRCYVFSQKVGENRQFKARNVATDQEFLFSLDSEKGQIVVQPGHEEPVASPSAEEVAKELANPNTAMGSLSFFIDTITYDGDLPGADGASATQILFQPSLPYPLSKTSNIFFRPAIPFIIDRDVPDITGGFDTVNMELGDISFDASYGHTYPGGFVTLTGIAGTLPTATDDSVGLDQWLLGPEVALAWKQPWGVIGMLVSHQWDVAGEDSFDTSITSGQYFYNFSLGNGWALAASPVVSYNHEAESDDAFSFPLGVGITKTVMINRRPWQFGVQYWNYIEQADTFGVEHQIRITLKPVIQLPW